MDDQMREIEAFEQAQKDARNPHLRKKLRTKMIAARLTPEEFYDWKRIKVPIAELLAAGIRHHRKSEDRQKLIREAIRAFLTTVDGKTMPRERMRAILLSRPMRPTLEEIEEQISQMVADRELDVLYQLT